MTGLGFSQPPALRSRRPERAGFVSLLGVNPRPRASPAHTSLGSQLAGFRSPRLRRPQAAAAPGRVARGNYVAQSLVAQQSSGEEEGKRLLFAGNLPWVIDSYALRRLFEPFGTVLGAQVVHDDENDRSLGYGHVLMADEANALKAIKEMDRREVGGRTINVHFVRKQARVTTKDNFDLEDDRDRFGGRGGRGGRYIDQRAMRFNPGAPGGSQYATESQEKLTLQYARDFMDSNFLAKLQDPRLRLDEDVWLDYPIEDQDDEYDWNDYTLSWDRWDPKLKKVVEVARMQPLRPQGTTKSIDWDNDFCADPLQV